MNSKLSPAMEEAITAMAGCMAERIDTPWWTWWQVIGINRCHISNRTMKALERRGLVVIFGRQAKLNGISLLYRKGVTMKAISLWQPWASLVAIGAKRIETRGWATRYRGPLAIHAAKNRQYWKIAHDEPFRSVLMEATLFRQDDLPYGAVIATCILAEVCAIKEDGLYRLDPEQIEPPTWFAPLPVEPEISFGDYTLGRFAWVLENLKILPEPIPAKGKQGLWNWEPPEEIEI